MIGTGSEHDRKKGAVLLLIGVTVVWGLTFSLVRMTLKEIGPFLFMTWRFTLAGLVITPPALLKLKKARGDTLQAGILLGTLLFASYAFQTIGLKYTSAGNAGFITGLFIVFVPVLSFLVLKKAPDSRSITSVLLALAGLAFLSIQPGLKVNRGDLLVLACAFCYSVHIILLDSYSKEHNLAVLTMIQMWVLAVLSSASTAIFEGFAITGTWIVWLSVLICGTFASAIAFYIQAFAQRVLSPVRTAIILIMEPVFSVVFGYLLLGERLSMRGWIGCALIFSGMLLAEATPKAKSAVETHL